MAVPRIGRSSLKEEETPTPAVLPVDDATAAAEILLQYLPGDVAGSIREVSTHMQLPVWQLLLGYTMRCSDGMLLYSPFVISQWDAGQRPSKTPQ